ncbi:Cellulose biosynthesis protein BcsQ [Flaviramulus basaltis]|uniref:Cellulose biosynthesis protein BcsQ n=1 Tax=Flaviramulus basaltis TaxID=369401 RepID=A0A1K2IQY3_9FLAO|nr:ParA family protein [Flaviramulus basaltis]SFZ94852.1 Cellulose biosynthesis protein BcsQ [Flaviramulus basaltis]|tara:strand:+ start:20256 stop:20960 length:705 start_codon:yes stop_codon:yes gene_type:complete
METKIISIAGEKGGVGKTTLNIMLATNLFHLYSKKVVLMDYDDPQYSVFKKRERELNSIDENEKNDLEIYPIEKVSTSNIKNTIIQYYGKVDYIIIDFHGGLTQEMIEGLMFVEHIFIPFDHDELEIDSTYNFYLTLKSNFLENEERVLKSVHLFFNQYRKIQKNKFAVLKGQLMSVDLPFMKNVVKEKEIYRTQYRNTLFPIPDNKELGELDIKKFFKEIMELTSKEIKELEN